MQRCDENLIKLAKNIFKKYSKNYFADKDDLYKSITLGSSFSYYCPHLISINFKTNGKISRKSMILNKDYL